MSNIEWNNNYKFVYLIYDSEDMEEAFRGLVENNDILKTLYRKKALSFGFEYSDFDSGYKQENLKFRLFGVLMNLIYTQHYSYLEEDDDSDEDDDDTLAIHIEGETLNLIVGTIDSTKSFDDLAENDIYDIKCHELVDLILEKSNERPHDHKYDELKLSIIKTNPEFIKYEILHTTGTIRHVFDIKRESLLAGIVSLDKMRTAGIDLSNAIDLF